MPSAAYFSPKFFEDYCDPESGLSDLAFNLWPILITCGIGGRCGVFRAYIPMLCLLLRRTPEQLEEGFVEFEELGWIKRDKAKGYIWIVKFVEYQSKSRGWARLCADEASGLADKTELVTDFFEFYNDLATEKKEVTKSKATRKKSVTNQLETGKKADRKPPHSQSHSHTHSQSHTQGEAQASPPRKLTLDELKKEARANASSLADLEQKTPKAWLPLWAQWKTLQAKARKGESVAESVLIGELIEFHVQQEAKQLSDSAMVHGLVTTIRKFENGKLNKLPTGYVVQVALSFDQEQRSNGGPTEPSGSAPGPQPFDMKSQHVEYAIPGDQP